MLVKIPKNLFSRVLWAEDKIVGSEDKKKSEDEKSTQKSAIVNPFHARLIAKHQQEAVEKAKQEVEAKAKAQAALRLEFENSCFRCLFLLLCQCWLCLV